MKRKTFSWIGSIKSQEMEIYLRVILLQVLSTILVLTFHHCVVWSTIFFFFFTQIRMCRVLPCYYHLIINITIRIVIQIHCNDLHLKKARYVSPVVVLSHYTPLILSLYP